MYILYVLAPNNMALLCIRQAAKGDLSSYDRIESSWWQGEYGEDRKQGRKQYKVTLL